mmetsp:Transcript_23814/g.53258  ORF Transcript_23814/g.53258 Transcript_23814/m.53258 type:complete len:700 (+) Transcript_23814:295-2394(+)
MEELQDAIEDAQYVSAISSAEDGPRPVLPWEVPEEEELKAWREEIVRRHKEEEKSAEAGGEGGNGAPPSPAPFGFEWTLAHALGLFLFSAYVKEISGEYLEMNFVEEVLRWKSTRGRYRAEKTSFILENYLTPTAAAAGAGSGARTEEGEETTAGEAGTAKSNGNSAAPAAEAAKAATPKRSEIVEYDLLREPSDFAPDEVKEIRSSADPTRTCVGVGGSVLDDLLARADKLRNAPGYDYLSAGADPEKGRGNERDSSRNLKRSLRNLSMVSNGLPENLFDEAELLVSEKLREKHWSGFQKSEQHTKLLNFLWFRDRKVVEEDFFVMRVLGRGGFGLVTACKKGTSGKLYAMKVMNKKRIKLNKAEQLTLNEQKCLAEVSSPFVVNLKYSFQSPTDVFLILDLMTGGDLGYHLSQKGCFPRKECLYYGARIMLGLQALHDKGYVYRDLKPENCLLGEDGRVKLTDLGLATKITPTLHGAAGTRGYWAPEMLRRDSKGKRRPYGNTVDWFSFGCCLAEFISGTNPFRSEEALNFGMEKAGKRVKGTKVSKEKAIDCATLEMQPEFDSKFFNENAADICRRLLDKNEQTRLGVNGCNEIMSHPWFRDINWEEIIADRKRPPFVPPKDVNAASQSDIGTFAEDKTFQDTVLTEKDQAVYAKWQFTNEEAFAAEVIEFLIYERETGQPLLPLQQSGGCCCAIS